MIATARARVAAFTEPGTSSGSVFHAFVLLCLVTLAFFMFEHVEFFFGIQTQLFIGWGMLGLLYALKRSGLCNEFPWRIVVVVLAALLSFRYLIWRTSETLVYTEPIDAVGMMLLYFAEVFGLGVHFFGLGINSWPLRREPLMLSGDPASWPTVDVVIPAYTEPEEIVRVTATAAAQIDYPKDKLRIYILDDGSTADRRAHPRHGPGAWQRYYSLKGLARDLGIGYLTREHNVRAKAGNINHALTKTSGEIVLVLDCDHVPTPDILMRTVGYFMRDPKLYLVQTPHFFINPTPVERNLNDPYVPYESDMFFRAIHYGLDSWNASYFCGSAALIRRSHLLEIGGVAGESITEDAETAVQLHAKGYNSIFVDRPMICGLSPETFDDYITQRSRWAQGMIQIFILSNPVMARGLTLAQRVAYLNSCMFWFFGFSRFTFYIAPALFLLLGLKVYHATLPQLVAYGLPHLFSTYIVMDFLYGKVRLPIFSDIYESVQAVFLLPAIISVMISPRKPTFKITPKGRQLASGYLNQMATSFYTVVLINMCALPLAVQKWVQYPLYRDVIIMATSWCLFNMVLSIISLGAFWETRQVRKHHRLPVEEFAEVTFPAYRATHRARVRDISLTGMGVEVDTRVAAHQHDEVRVRATSRSGRQYEFRASVGVIKRSERKDGGVRTFCGLEFELDEAAYPEAVSFVYGDSARWVEVWDRRCQSSGIARKLAYFFWIGLLAGKESTVSLARAIYGTIITYAFVTARGVIRRIRLATG
jgi:cellulose synthase (UDP-forming)